MDNQKNPIIYIDNLHLHLHLNEQMLPKALDNPVTDDSDDTHDLDMDDEKLIELIHKDTNIPLPIVSIMMKSQNKILDHWFDNGGIDEDDDEPEDEPEHEPDEDKPPVPDMSKVQVSHAGLTLVDFLRGIISELEKKPRED